MHCRNLVIKKGPKGLAKFGRFNEVSLYRGSFPYNFTIPKVKKKIVRYTEDFVILRFVISSFHCTRVLCSSVDRKSLRRGLEI